MVLPTPVTPMRIMTIAPVLTPRTSTNGRPCLVGGLPLLATKDEMFDRAGKTVLYVALRNVRRLRLDFVSRIAHGDAYTALAKHQQIGRHIANGGNLLRGDVQHLRQ